MSRPPQYETNAHLATRRSVIDFVGVPQPPSNYSTNYQPEDCIQSGYPAPGPYPVQSGYLPSQAAYQPPYQPVQTAYQPPYQSPYQPPYQPVQAPYQAPYPQYQYPSQYAAAPYTPEPVCAQPSITEDALREKINTKIDSIMESHRSEVLSNQIERLTDKVQVLSHSLQAAHARPSPMPASLAEPDRDEELSKRLKRLAAESSKQLHPRF